jgi:hypothetical protein
MFGQIKRGGGFLYHTRDSIRDRGRGERSATRKADLLNSREMRSRKTEPAKSPPPPPVTQPRADAAQGRAFGFSSPSHDAPLQVSDDGLATLIQMYMPRPEGRQDRLAFLPGHRAGREPRSVLPANQSTVCIKQRPFSGLPLPGTAPKFRKLDHVFFSFVIVSSRCHINTCLAFLESASIQPRTGRNLVRSEQGKGYALELHPNRRRHLPRSDRRDDSTQFLAHRPVHSRCRAEHQG